MATRLSLGSRTALVVITRKFLVLSFQDHVSSLDRSHGRLQVEDWLQLHERLHVVLVHLRLVLVHPQVDPVLVHPQVDPVLVHPQVDPVLVHPQIDLLSVVLEQLHVDPQVDPVLVHPQIDLLSVVLEQLHVDPQVDPVLVHPQIDLVSVMQVDLVSVVPEQLQVDLVSVEQPQIESVLWVVLVHEHVDEPLVGQLHSLVDALVNVLVAQSHKLESLEHEQVDIFEGKKIVMELPDRIVLEQALRNAVQADDRRAVMRLVDMGVGNVDEGLVMASIRGNVPLVKYFLSHGATVVVEAYELAILNRHFHVAKILSNYIQ